MANLYSIARPYALAAFEAAQDANELPQWKVFLQTAAIMVQDKTLAKILDNPGISVNKLDQLFSELLASVTTEKCRNFLHLLAQNKRLAALPEINTLYSAYLAELEKISNIRVITAFAMNDGQQQTLASALSKRMNHEVSLHCEIDPHIIGGAVIHIGDRVIDGSIRGKLTRLLEFSLR